MTAPSFSLSDQVVIVTGGAGLLGIEYCHVLQQAGAHAVVVDIDEARVETIVKDLLAQDGPEPMGFAIDITDKAAVQNMTNQVLSHFGRIDGLVNNAALNPKFEAGEAEKHTNNFEDYPVELWNQSLAVDLTGMFLCTQAVATTMLVQKKGAIVNISSTYGQVAPDQRLYEHDDPTLPLSYKPITYSVTKSAVMGFTRYLAAYWGGKGIRVNTLTLGGVFNNHPDEFVRRYSSRTPLGRMADKTEYSGALLYLLSDASSYMTGSNLIVDGGWTAW